MAVTEADATDATDATEIVVRRHLQAFLEQRGVDAIVSDYGADACFYTEAAVYRGRDEVAGFFRDFLAALPAGAIDRFALRTLRVGPGVAFLTWSVSDEIPLGTDTFVVADGAIVSQTFAMHARPA